jgi:hypothetical protein
VEKEAVMRRLVAGSLLVLATALPTGALADDGRAPRAPKAFGSDNGVLLIPGLEFRPEHSVTTFAVFEHSLHRTGGGSTFMAPIYLESGSEIVLLEVEACDEIDSGRIAVSILSCPAPLGACTVPASVGTTDFGTPGCNFFFASPPTPYTVDNYNNTLMISAFFFSSTSQVRLRAVRIYWHRQVSPAPATATFGDVPTSHPFFRFVEALYNSGITAGCGGGNYCPDQPVTRGQMAVFLSEALGLHWPN